MSGARGHNGASCIASEITDLGASVSRTASRKATRTRPDAAAENIHIGRQR